MPGFHLYIIYSYKQQTTAVIYTLAVIIPAANRTVECHDGCHGTVNFLRGFLLIRLDVSGRVGADEDVVHHPTKDRMATVGDALLQHQLHQFLGR